MIIAIVGASGFIGKHLTAYLSAKGHEVICISRNVISKQEELALVLSKSRIVINLAGAPINQRWTDGNCRVIFDSRVYTTKILVDAINSLEHKPELFISTSAVGYYPYNRTVDESWKGSLGGLLSNVTTVWEYEALKVSSDTRLVIMRLGMVMSFFGGVFPRMFASRRFGVVFTMGSGRQMFPWIDIRDVIRAIEMIISTPTMKGTYNFVAPERISQNRFVHKVAKHFGCLIHFHVPAFVLKLIMGESSELLLKGQSVVPKRLIESGFKYIAPQVDDFLRNPDTSTVKNIDFNRYVGKWYEVARYDNRFERGLIMATANYSLVGRYIKIENAGVEEKTGKYRVAHGKAVVSKLNGSRLRVSFLPFIYSDYNILELDETSYSYAVIGSNSYKYLWILSRSPHLKDEVKQLLLKKLEKRGYDISQLLWMK